jgi:hypothetical protein
VIAEQAADLDRVPARGVGRADDLVVVAGDEVAQ